MIFAIYFLSRTMLPPPPRFINRRDFASSSSSILCALIAALARVRTPGLEAARLQAATISHPAPRAPLGEGRGTARGRGRRARLRSQGDPTRMVMCCGVLHCAETACLEACGSVAEERIFLPFNFVRTWCLHTCTRQGTCPPPPHSPQLVTDCFATASQLSSRSHDYLYHSARIPTLRRFCFFRTTCASILSRTRGCSTR